MNIFRKNDSELTAKVEGYETHILNLETELANQSQKIDDLSTQVQALLNQVREKEEIVTVAETILEQTEQELVEVKEQLEEKQEVIAEVLENTMTVEKQAAIKAAIILGDMGAPVVETIDAPEEVDIISQMKNLKDKQLVEFYQKNRNEIIKAQELKHKNFKH